MLKASGQKRQERARMSLAGSASHPAASVPPDRVRLRQWDTLLREIRVKITGNSEISTAKAA